MTTFERNAMDTEHAPVADSLDAEFERAFEEHLGVQATLIAAAAQDMQRVAPRMHRICRHFFMQGYLQGVARGV
jgi:hypothetical protein